MLRILLDTCVWLDIAKDYRHRPTLAALEQLIEANKVSLILPKQSVEEFARNKDRIIRESGKSLSSTFKRVKEAVKQFGYEEGRAKAIAILDDVDHRITILGEATNESVQRIEKLFAGVAAIETSDGVKLRAAQRALDGRAPFHKDKNSIGDAILIETFIDSALGGNANDHYAFVTHNKHDFSNMGIDERQPHPDLAKLFSSESCSYSLALGDVLSKHAPE
jgi:hypothetical protein